MPVPHSLGTRQNQLVAQAAGELDAGRGGWRTWIWFVTWFGAGAGCVVGVLSILTIGIFVLPVAVVVTVFVATRRTSAVGIGGIVSGLGLPFLLVAYFNRNGPGDVCRTSPTATSCTQEWSPWPWLAIGLALAVLGVLIFVRMRRRSVGAPVPIAPIA